MFAAAMAYIKLSHWRAAEEDCSRALQLDPAHEKSWLRRAVSRNALGYHAAAEVDLEAALALSASKEAAAELRKTRELRRACALRAPATALAVAEGVFSEASGDFVAVPLRSS